MFIPKKKFNELLNLLKESSAVIEKQNRRIEEQNRTIAILKFNLIHDDIDFPNSEERGFNTANTGFNDDPNDILFN